MKKVLIAVMLLGSVTVVNAESVEPGSTPDQYVAAAEAAWKGGKIFEALRIIGEASAQYPGQGKVYLAYGKILNGMNYWEAAHLRLQQARELGVDSPELHQELGKALMGLGQYDEALAALDRAPVTGSNLLARAATLIQLQRPEEAIQLLDQAQELQPDTETRVRLLRSQALAMTGRIEEAKQEVATGRELAEEAWLKDLYGRLDDALTRHRVVPAEIRDWGVSLTLGVGHNDNVVLRPDEAAGVLAQELADKDDVFFIQQLHAWTRLTGDQRKGLIAQGRLTALEHSDLDDYNQLYVNGGLLAYTQLNGEWRGEAGIDADYGNVDNEDFSLTGSVYGTLRWQQTDRTRSNLTYRFSYRDFMFPSIAEENRDGPLHVLTFTQDIIANPGGQRVHLTPFVELGLEDTDGASMENTFWGAGVGARCELTDELSVFASGAYRDREYKNPNVRTAFALDRDDEQWRVGAGLRYDVTSNVYATFAWGYVENDSNIPASFSYDQNTFTFAITIEGP